MMTISVIETLHCVEPEDKSCYAKHVLTDNNGRTA